MNLDNKCTSGFIAAGTEYQYAGIFFMLQLVCSFSVDRQLMRNTFKGTKHPEHQKVMRGELRGELFVC